MKKMAIVFVVLFFWLLLREALAGGVYIDFEIPDSKTQAFANEFMREMQKKKILTSFFTGHYRINGYLGALPDQDVGQLRSAIGIFIDNGKRSVFRVWFDELYSEKQIKEKAKEAADKVFQRLKEKEEKKKNSIKIPI